MKKILNYCIELTKSILKYFDYLVNHATLIIHHVQIESNWVINGQVFIRNYGKLVIGDNFRVNSGNRFNPIGGDSITRIVTESNGFLSIGNNVGISNSSIICSERIEIADFVFIGGDCKIWDTNFHSIDPIERSHSGDNQIKTAPIKIEAYAFIGASTIILKGVRVGINSVVGAGSVVTKNIPDNEVWGGNPARFIRNL